MESVMKTMQPSSMQTEWLRVGFGALEEKLNAIEATKTAANNNNEKTSASPHQV